MKIDKLRAGQCDCRFEGIGRKLRSEYIATLIKHHALESEERLLGSSTYRDPHAPAIKLADAIE